MLAACRHDSFPHRCGTLATQAVNRGMLLEAIAALPGHEKMEMTLIYAPVANGVVAEEYAAVSAKIDELRPAARHPRGLRDHRDGPAASRNQARMLGNGLCTRPVDLDCRMGSACETCAYFSTDVKFVPILTRQRGHGHERGQTDRAAPFDKLIDDLD